MYILKTESDAFPSLSKAYMSVLSAVILVLLFVTTCRVASAQTIAPPVIEDGNPFLDNTFTSVHVGTTYTTTNVFVLGVDVQRTGLGYAHPQSPNFGDTAYRDRLLYILDFAAIEYGTGSFALYENVALAYALLKAYHPDELSASRQAAYETYLTRVSNSYVESWGQLWLDKDISTSWYNAEVRWALGVYISGIALDNDTFKSVGAAFFDKEYQEMLLQGDGGFNYVGYQNETYTYHNANIIALAWYYLISGDEDAREIIEKTAAYWPLMTYDGIGEYYTAASWKHYWNNTSPHPSAYIVGALSHDPYNLEMAANPGGDPILSFLYSPNLPNSTVLHPDNYTIVDRNIKGPRGRYGTFGFAGTARVVDNYGNYPESTRGVGKSTLVGAHVIKPGSGGGFSFDSAVDIVGIEVKYYAGQETEDRRRKYRFLTTNERSSTTAAKQIHGLTSTYNPSSKVNADTRPLGKLDWVIHEQWIFLPERLVGHLTVNSLIDDHQVYAVNSIVKTLSGRSWWGDQKELVDLGNGHYSFGRMRFIIREQNFNGETITEYGSIYSSSTSEKVTLHRILDNKSSGNPERLHAYDISDKYYYVVEIFEEGTEPAASISSGRNASVHRLTVDDGTRKVESILNITEAATVRAIGLNAGYTNASILKSWTADQAFNANAPAQLNVTIPAHQSILAIESSSLDDVDVNELYYEDAFVGVRECIDDAPCKDISFTNSAVSTVDFDEDIAYTLTISNSGGTAYTDARIISVLPYNGDTHVLPSSFSGSVQLLSVNNADRYYVSGDASETISSDPDTAELNNTWCTTAGTRVFGSGNCPATLADATAIYAIVDGPIGPNEDASIAVVLDANGYGCSDVWTSAAGLRANQITLFYESSSVSVKPDCVAGDVNCDNQVNILDALFIMQYEVRTRTDSGICPINAAEQTLNLQPGDVNGDNAINVLDALVIMQCEARIANALCPQ